MSQYVEEPRGRRSNTAIIVGTIIVLAVIAAVAFGLLRVDQTREAELPTVKVQGGQTPSFDVKTADVDVSKKDVAVEVPKVTTTTTKVEVPTVEINKAR